MTVPRLNVRKRVRTAAAVLPRRNSAMILTLDRPGLERALAMLKPGKADALLVKLDRLTRSVVDVGTLVER